MTNPDEPIHQLTKREEFARSAMIGFIASEPWTHVGAGKDHAKATAGYAVMYADALIEALNEPTDEK
jgi:hypothetical protein